MSKPFWEDTVGATHLLKFYIYFTLTLIAKKSIMIKKTYIHIVW